MILDSYIIHTSPSPCCYQSSQLLWLCFRKSPSPPSTVEHQLPLAIHKQTTGNLTEYAILGRCSSAGTHFFFFMYSCIKLLLRFISSWKHLTPKSNTNPFIFDNKLFSKQRNQWSWLPARLCGERSPMPNKEQSSLPSSSCHSPSSQHTHSTSLCCLFSLTWLNHIIIDTSKVSSHIYGRRDVLSWIINQLNKRKKMKAQKGLHRRAGHCLHFMPSII